MKIINSSEATEFFNSTTCWGKEFGFGDKDFNVAVATVNGRYPATGHLVNEACKEVAYVVSGHGVVGVGDVENKLNPGDAVYIKAGERYYWQGENMEMVITCCPAFFSEQHKEVA